MKLNRGKDYGIIAPAVLAALVLVLAFGCPPASKSVAGVGNLGVVPKNTLCNEAVCDLQAGGGDGTGTTVGQVQISNDNDNLYVTFAMNADSAIKVSHVDVLCSMPDMDAGRPNPGGYCSHRDGSGRVLKNCGGLPVDPNGDDGTYVQGASVTHDFAFGTVAGSDGCTIDVNCSDADPTNDSQTVYILAHAETSGPAGADETAFGGFNQDCVGATGIPNTGNGWWSVIEYTITCCGDDPPGGGDGCRTQTQGGWGAPARGENPGTIRDAVFDICFPNGLTIGCDYTLTLTSAAAVEAFLPTGGKPGALTQNHVDPVGPVEAGVLAGQLVALEMTLCADATFPDFSECDPGTVAGLCTDFTGTELEGSALDGLTVEQIADLANEVIGGCDNGYGAGELADALMYINENFTDGEMDLGMLVDCS